MKILSSFLVFLGVLTFSFLGFAQTGSMPINGKVKNSWPLFQAAVNSSIDFDLLVGLVGKGHGEVRSKLPGIDCDADKTDCIEEYDPNTVVTLNAYSEIDSIFSGWVGACESSLKPTCTVNMSQDREITALFTLRPVVIEKGLWWGLHNGGRPTFYFSKLMADYPSEFVVKMAGCETAVVTTNGHRFETNLLVVKQSDVSGRGMAVTTTGGVCESSRECSVTYYK